jgi:coenzyme Q-binding protein COQ10
MGLIKAEVIVDAIPEKVFALAQRVEDYPDFMPDVQEVEILKRDESTGITHVRWVGKVEIQSIRKLVRWVEEVRWNASNLSADFTLIKGDYKKYGGKWRFKKLDGGKTKLSLEIDFDLGLPLVGPLINKLLDKIMLTNCQGMLDAIKIRVEKS